MQRKAQLEHDGYLHVPALFDAATVARLRTLAAEIEAAPDRPGGVMRYYEEKLRGRVLNRAEYLRSSFEALRAVMERGPLPALVAEVLGEDVVLFKDKINYKHPGGAAFEPHQDAQAGWLDHCAYQVSCLVALDNTTVANGCLEVAAGHHRRGRFGPLGAPLSGDTLEGLHFVPVEAAAGDVVVFDCFTPHQSGPNRTEHARRVLYATYNPRSQGDHYERYFAAKRKSFPPDCERAPGREYRYRV